MFNPFNWRNKIKTYVFKVVIEPDVKEDGTQAYHAYCPLLEKYGAATWGYTQEEAIKNIQEVLQLVIEELHEEGKSIPEQPADEVEVFYEPHVAVSV